MKLQRVRNALSDGLLSFPITDMDESGNFNLDSYRRRIQWFLEHDVSAIFVAGGTGEFFSLSQEEYRQIVFNAVEIVSGRVPVISSVGRSIVEAEAFAELAEQAGVDGLLLMPPYLTNCPRTGAMSYAKSIMQRTALPTIYYNRSNGILKAEHLAILAEECDNLVALKDGTGHIQDLNDIIKTLGDRLVYIGGVPTAEIISEAYLAIGVNTYSSAVFNFVPQLAISFYRALRAGDSPTVHKILEGFIIPFVRLRCKKAGYAVSLIKAGTTIVGKGGGSVRPPLEMPTPQETEALRLLIDWANDFVDDHEA